MIGISIAAKWEWEATLKYFNKTSEDCTSYPYGDYFKIIKNNKELIIYQTGVRKVNGIGANQYMIDNFKLDKIIVAGTCAGIDDSYKPLDIIVANKALQYDCTVKEIEPLIKESFIVNLDYSKYDYHGKTGTIGTSDKAVVMWNDYIEIKNNNITVADTEAGAIAYICKKNNVECIIIKGISDFPINEKLENMKQANEEQMNVYIENTPKVMNIIFDEYLEIFI